MTRGGVSERPLYVVTCSWDGRGLAMIVFWCSAASPSSSTTTCRPKGSAYMHLISMCITSAKAPLGEPTPVKKHSGGHKWYRTLTGYSVRLSLLESESVTLSLRGLPTLLWLNERRAARRPCRGLYSGNLGLFSSLCSNEERVCSSKCRVKKEKVHRERRKNEWGAPLVTSQRPYGI